MGDLPSRAEIAESTAPLPVADRVVVIVSRPGAASYPQNAPFLPDEAYPELGGRVAAGGETNFPYRLLRAFFRNLGWDAGRFSTPAWNPLGTLIRPGQHVLVKPNLVRHLHLAGGDYRAVVTHASLVRAVLDYVALALDGRGAVTVGDAPVQSTDFDVLLQRTRLREVCGDVAATWGIPVQLVDFRLRSVSLDGAHRIVRTASLEGDGTGYRAVNFGSRSLLAPLGAHPERYRVTNYDGRELVRHHDAARNEYLIPRSVLDADVVLNLPKLKTHRKVCVTGAMKNMVGINGHKDWLPHHRVGSLDEGGDEYLARSSLKRFRTLLAERIDRSPFSPFNALRRLAIRITSRLARIAKSDPYQEGSWYGNDTLWRTVLDLNRLLLYAGRDGRIRETPQRRCLTLIDAVVAGEGEGPMEPDARPCGALIGGTNPVAVDAVAATLMGFDFRRIPLIARGFEIRDLALAEFPPEQIEVRARDSAWDGLRVGNPRVGLRFRPPSGWRGYVEFPKPSEP